MIDSLQKVVKNLNKFSFKSIAGLLILAGAALFAAGAIFATSILTLFSLLAVAAGAILGVLAFILSKLR